MSLIGESAYAVIESHLGEHEDRGNGKANDGAPVIWACRRWFKSESTFRRYYDAGKLEWCAGATCAAFDDAGSKSIGRVVALNCNDLMVLCERRGYMRDKPAKGHIFFAFKPGAATPHHVGICGDIDTDGTVNGISGNTGEHIDEIGRNHYKPGSTLRFAEIPD